MSILAAAAVNERDTLAQCLARSPDIVASGLPLKTFEGYKTAGEAYNAAIDAAGSAGHIIFVHQDVYLPAGTLARLEAQLAALDVRDPTWAIAGVIGGDTCRALIGETWCSGHQRLLGTRVDLPAQVETLDEMLLIYRVSSGLRFDEGLPSFHLYGADIVLVARRAGRTTWVIDLPVVHHSRPVVSLSGAYLTAYRYIQRKWRAELPVFNLVCPLERGLWRYWLTEFRLRRKWQGVRGRPDAIGDAVHIARRLGYEGEGL